MMAKITLSIEFCEFFIIEETKVNIKATISVPTIPAMISPAINLFDEMSLYLINTL